MFYIHNYDFKNSSDLAGMVLIEDVWLEAHVLVHGAHDHTALPGLHMQNPLNQICCR